MNTKVRQAAQVLELLEFFAQIKRPAALAEISETLNWPRSSTFNLLNTLKSLGYLYEPRPKGGVYPSPRWRELVETISSGETPPIEMERLLEHLAGVTGETTALAVPNAAQAIFVGVHESAFPIRYTTQIGNCVPMHATAAGRALLSQRSSADRLALLRRADYIRYTPNTLTDPDEIEAEIRRSIEKGYFVGKEEYSPGLMGVALALPMPARHYALLISGPVDRLKNRVDEIAKAMFTAVHDILGIDLLQSKQ
ncbi:IclR family transcriptional regulator [Caballeronia sp. LP006]|uniref:IclR family transcriptional regulator n=1 Tax=Caballeronia sp. LP006 TaxID=3038552 RepID=UPI002858EBB6|nr:IclR family transcriptional regulator [Caballeronia sp. LP006]MDR5826291.1 IclR family transcriptional regulator [Caballeronia sp. LP006]